MSNWKRYLPAVALLLFGLAQGAAGIAIEMTLYAAFYVAGLYRKEYALYLLALSFPFMTYRPLMFFLIVLLLLNVAEGISRERLRAVVTSKVFLAASLFIGVTGLTAVTSVSLSESLSLYLLYYVPSLLFLAVLMYMADSRTVLYRFLLCFVASGALVSLYGISQYFTMDGVKLAWVDIKANPLLSKRIFATFGNPNIFSQYLILVLPTAFVFLYAVKEFKHKVLLSALFAVTALALLLTFSRGAWVAVALAFFLMLLKVDRKLILAGLTLVLIAFAFDLLPEVIKQRLESIVNPGEDSSGSYRFSIWKAAIAVIRDYWVTGIGLDQSTFFKVYADYQMPDVNVFHFHNIWLQVFATGGILAILSFLWLFYQTAKVSFTVSANREQRRLGLWGIAMFASLLAFAVVGLTEDAFRDYRVMFAFWMIVGVVGVLELLADRPQKQERMSHENL